MPPLPLRIFYRGWAAISWLTFGLMCLYTSNNATLLGRYSASYALTLGIVLIASLITTLLAVTSDRILLRLPSATTRLSAVTAIIMMIAGLGILLQVTPVSTKELGPLVARIYLVNLLILFCLWWLRNTSRIPDPPPLAAVAFLLGGSVVLVTILYAGRTPAALYWDEGYVSLFTREWFRTGNPVEFLPGLQTVPNFQLITLSYFSLGVWFQLLPVTFESARLWALCMTLLSLPIVFVTFRHKVRLSLLVLAMGAGASLFLPGAYIRGDTFVPVIVALAIFFYLSAHGRWYQHFVVGFLLAISVEAHQLGIRFALAFGLIYSWHYIQAIIRERRYFYQPFWLLLLGGISYGLVYVVTRMAILSFTLPQLVAQIVSSYQIETGFALYSSVASRVLASLVQSTVIFARFYPALFILVGVGTILCLWYKNRLLHLSVSLWWLALGIGILLNPKPNGELVYAVHLVLPAILILVGLLEILQDRIWLALALVMSVISLNVFSILYNSRQNEYYPIIETGYDIAQRLPESVDTVVANQLLWWGLQDRHYYYVYAALRYSFNLEDEQLLREHHLPIPQAVVLNSLIEAYTDTMDYIEARGMVRSFCSPNKIYGFFAVYIVEELAQERDADCP